MDEELKEATKDLVDSLRPMIDSFETNALPVAAFLPDWDDDMFVRQSHIVDSDLKEHYLGGITNREMKRIVELFRKLNAMIEKDNYA